MNLREQSIYKKRVSGRMMKSFTQHDHDVPGCTGRPQPVGTHGSCAHSVVGYLSNVCKEPVSRANYQDSTTSKL